MISLVFTGCESAPPGYVYGGPYTPLPAYIAGQPTVVQIDPHSGTEYRDAMEAIGQAGSSFASPNAPINQQPGKTMNQLRGFGTLMDLLNR